MKTAHISGSRGFSKYHWWHEQTVVNYTDCFRIELLKSWSCRKFETGIEKFIKYLSENWTTNGIVSTNGNYLSKYTL